MIIQTQDKLAIVNSALLTFAALVRVGDKWAIGTESLTTRQALTMGEYETKERAQFELDRLVEAFARDAKVYVMPEE